MLIQSSPTHWRAHFDSVGDAERFISGTPSKWSLLRDHVGRTFSEYSWTLRHTNADVLRLARDGWEEGLAKLHDGLVGRPPAREHTSNWTFDVAGYYPDVPRYLDGDPTCMMRHGHPKGNKPVICIFVQVWINSMIDARQMMNYGVALTAYIDQIEKSGKRVELIAGVIAPHRNRKIMSATWTVKRAEDPVDLAAIAFSLAHPGASRRFGWALWERSDLPADSAFGQGGYSAKREDMIDPPEGMLFLPGVANEPSRCRTIEDAVAHVATQINRAAGEPIVEIDG